VEKYRAGEGEPPATTIVDNVAKITRSAEAGDGKKAGDAVIDLRLGTKVSSCSSSR